MDSVVFRPERFYGTGEGEDILGVEAVIGGGRGRVPLPAAFNGFAGVVADEGAGIGVVWGAPDVLKAPMEWLDAAVVVGGPAAVLIAADFAFEPVHEKSRQFTVYS